MTTIFDVPEVQERVMRWTVEEYESLSELGLLPKNVELIRGVLIEKMSKSPLHGALSKRLYDLILRALPEGFVVYHENPLRLADSEPEPDIAVLRGTERDFDERHATTAALVIEIAVTSAALDRANAGLYAEAGVEEYWIFLGRERAVEVYTVPLNGVYTQHRVVAAGESLVCTAVPEISLPLLGAVF